MIPSFSFSTTPDIQFGNGARQNLPELLSGFGTRVLLATGQHSFDHSVAGQELLAMLSRFDLRRIRIEGEPSPEIVDNAVGEFREFSPHVVVAIGGGSAIDAAKAIAGLLPSGDSVMDYLEGVGQGKAYHGPSTPLVAVPTTAGTGGETSKNAVLSVVGEKGFKKSFRHDCLVAKTIILDPELTRGCSAEVTAACGMDAFTQLLESYVASRAGPMTDALALSGLEAVRDALVMAVEEGDDIEARSRMLYASSISGLTLANAGLGSVHGLASPLGAFFPIPHGVVCGTLLFDATRINIRALSQRDPQNPALEKYAAVGRMFAHQANLAPEAAREALLGIIQAWSGRFAMPRLSQFGVAKSDIPRIVANARGNSMQTNPVRLTDDEIAELIGSRL